MPLVKAANRRDHFSSPGQRGQSLIEFAIALPVVLVILLFAVDFGRAFQAVVTLNNAARIGANYASTHPYAWDAISSPTDIEQQADFRNEVAREVASIGCTPGTASAPQFPPAPNFPGNSLAFGQPAKLDLLCTFHPITPLIGQIVGNNLVIASEAIFPIRTGVPGQSPPTPPCFNQAVIPDVIGDSPAQADAAIFAAGLVPSGTGSETKGPHKVQTQNPASGACAPLGTFVFYTYRP